MYHLVVVAGSRSSGDYWTEKAWGTAWKIMTAEAVNLTYKPTADLSPLMPPSLKPPSFLVFLLVREGKLEVAVLSWKGVTVTVRESAGGSEGTAGGNS